MKLRLSLKTIRPTLNAALATGMLVGSIASAAPAVAAPKAPSTVDREAVLRRAKSWTKAKVPYSQLGYQGGYRRDCSGFIAMAWNLPENLVTWNVPLVAKPISRDQLKPGDVLLNTKRNRHVVMFEKWADKKRTKYIVLEQTGQSGVNRAIRRVMPFPYQIDGSLYKAYRYTGMKRYWQEIPKNARQPVRGYKLAGAKQQRVKAASTPGTAVRPASKQRVKPTAERKTAAARPNRAESTPKPASSRATGTRRSEQRTARARAAERVERTVRPSLFSVIVSWLSPDAGR